MAAFQTPVAIVNRGLQHCGVAQLDGTLGFTQQSKSARETSSCYDGLRRTELRSNTWRFATRKACLRPIDSNTLLLTPAVWVSTTTYFVGSVVSDASNNLWISQIPNNLGNPPTSASGAVTQPYWAPYFGPMTVSLYDSSQGYFAGELVYTAAGDGTYNTYLSLLSGNEVHPALPNQWSTQTTYFKNQVVQTWPAWASGTTYSKGQGVLYTDGNVYASLTNSNVSNIPPSSGASWALVPVLTLASQQVPQTTSTLNTPPTSSPVLEWAQASTYSIGSVVMFNASEYLSLVNSNTGNFPNAAGSTSWVVISNSTQSMSLIDLNIGNNPANSAANWAVGTTYATGNTVNGSDGLTYTSLSNGNVGHDPTTDGGVHWSKGGLTPWTTVYTQGGGNDMWMQIGGASFPNGVGLSGLNITYPLGAGPMWQTWTRNAYRLPAGYLKRAPQDPTAGSFSWLGAPTYMVANDWQFEGNYLVTMESTPIVFRFVADVTDVTQMDDQFCEMLAAKIGSEVCETLTQSSAKVSVCQAQYKLANDKARQSNAIEIGAEEPALDDYIACRQ